MCYIKLSWKGLPITNTKFFGMFVSYEENEENKYGPWTFCQLLQWKLEPLKCLPVCTEVRLVDCLTVCHKLLSQDKTQLYETLKTIQPPS